MVWILAMLGITAVIIALLGIFIWKLSKKNWKHETDYRTFFYMGLVWIIFSGAYMIFRNEFELSGLFAMGVIFFILGLANRNKWGKKVPVDPKMKKRMIIAVLVGLIALMIGIAAFLLIV